MHTLSSTYYDRLIGQARASFANLVQTGEWIEDGLKTGKIKDYQALFEHPLGELEAPWRKISLLQELRIMKWRFIQLGAMHPNTSILWSILLPFITHLCRLPHTMLCIILRLSITLSDCTHLIGPMTSGDRNGNRETLNGTQIKLLETSPLSMNHCQKYIWSC